MTLPPGARTIEYIACEFHPGTEPRIMQFFMDYAHLAIWFNDKEVRKVPFWFAIRLRETLRHVWSAYERIPPDAQSVELRVTFELPPETELPITTQGFTARFELSIDGQIVNGEIDRARQLSERPN